MTSDENKVVQLFGETGTSDQAEQEDRLVIVRPPNPVPDPTTGKCLAAVDLRKYGEFNDEAIVDLWVSCLDRISASRVDWYKAGAVIWDHLRMEIPPEWTAEMLGLIEADHEMGRASQAALFSAIATTVGPVDLELVLNALATFIHAHPRFADVAKEAVWSLPFGEDTAYVIQPFAEPKVRIKRSKRRRSKDD